MHKAFALAVLGLSLPAAAQAIGSPYARWSNGPSTDPGYFPIGVWLQQPRLASTYKSIGVNLYVGGTPSESELATLAAANMQIVPSQTAVTLAHLNDRTIVGWFAQDEPDNAQPDGTGGWGPPVPPSTVVANYTSMKAADPTRPVHLNLGQGVAWDGWYGRGVRTNHPEDYPEYLKGTDIGSFDIYPVDGGPETSGQLWRVPYGVDRMRQWSPPAHPVWSFVETTNINGAGPPTPAQVRSEVWMSLIHGSNGIIYFVHSWSPTFSDYAMLSDPVMKPAVAAINQEVRDLAPALNSPSISGVTSVVSSNATGPVDFAEKYVGDTAYLFAAEMRGNATTGTFTNQMLPARTTAEVIGESRQVSVVNGVIQEQFNGYGVHLYRITQTRSVWNAGTSGNWSDDARWSGGTPNGSGKRATLSSTLPMTVRIDHPQEIGSLRFDGLGPTTLEGSGTLTLAGLGTDADINVTAAASHRIDVPLTLTTNATIGIAAGGKLTLRKLTGRKLALQGELALSPRAQGGQVMVVQEMQLADSGAVWSGKLDLADNGLIVTSGVPDTVGVWDGTKYTGVQGQVASGRQSGSWNGPGISSSAAAAEAGVTSLGVATAAQAGYAGSTFDGVSISASDVLVMYTYTGDANLDGLISGDDYSAIDFNVSVPGADGWANGDFNYDGIISGDDYSAIDFSIVAQGAPFPTGGEPAEFTRLAAVPEPTAALIALVALAGSLASRGRRGDT